MGVDSDSIQRLPPPPGPDPGRFWRRYTDFGDIEFGRPQNKSRTKMKKGSQFITESKISKIRELIPALTRLCAQRFQDTMIDSRHLWKYACKFRENFARAVS